MSTIAIPQNLGNIVERRIIFYLDDERRFHDFSNVNRGEENQI